MARSASAEILARARTHDRREAPSFVALSCAMADGDVSVPQCRGLREVVGTRLEPFLRGFEERSFQLGVQDLVQRLAPEFLVACSDGSHPIVWTLRHREYREMFEEQLGAILEGLDIEREELIEWAEALRGLAEGLEGDSELPGTGGVRCADFDEFLKALTASEDYEHFVRVMFHAAAKFREEEADGEQGTGLLQEVEIAVPDGFGPGQPLTIEFLGATYELVIPDGCHSGATFRASVPVAPPLPLHHEAGN